MSSRTETEKVSTHVSGIILADESSESIPVVREG